MSKSYYIFFLCIILINAFIPTFQSNSNSASLLEGTVYEINQEIEGNTIHKKAEYDFKSTDQKVYFKYNSASLPSSFITTFRIIFDTYGTDISNYKVFCTNLQSSTTDTDLTKTLDYIVSTNSSCKDGFKRDGSYEGIIRLDKDKTLLGIILKEAKTGNTFTGRVNLRIKERILQKSDQKPNDEETYTFVPYTINLPTFREDSVSKILFYSYSRNMYMFYAGNEPYPVKLFAGKILSVYTNPNMVRQKYHDASIMTLWVHPFNFTQINDFKEDFQFEVKTYESNYDKYLLDYYVSSNSQGRALNTPLLINMTECKVPYYVILNYNKYEEKKKSLIIDQIYGKIKSISVAYNFTKSTWDEMITNDMNPVDLIERKFQFPDNEDSNLDVYKIECDLPIMLNFYYVDESDLISIMNYGDVNIYTLTPYENVNVPFFKNVTSPEIIIEIYNPSSVPTVVIVAQDETVYQQNTLIKLSPMSLANGITIKERAGLSGTRIIIKVGYPNSHWADTSDPNVKRNTDYDIYAFKFPMDDSKYNYTLAYLNTSGTNSDDNVKYCFTTNIGAALKPSLENCYRVSKSNPYCLKVYNPLNMFKDYSYDDKYAYYVTFKTETTYTSFDVKASMVKYDTTNRINNGMSSKITVNNKEAKSILSALKDNFMFVFLQIHVCDKTKTVKAKIKNALTNEEIAAEKGIPAGSKNNYFSFSNTLLDSELEISGDDNTNIFLRYAGLPTEYTPSFNNEYKITFVSEINTFIVEPPVNHNEYIEYIVIIDEENKMKEYTLCDFVNYNPENMGKYYKRVVTESTASLQINFDKIGFKVGQRFDAIIYIEQKMYSKMAFLSNIIQETVGDITIDSVHEIKDTYPQDNDYAYLTLDGKSDDLNYYFSFLPDKVLDVPFGSFRIELDEASTGSFTGVYCTFVNNDTDAFGRIEAVEELISLGDSYCIGSKSKINSKRYNYIFKYNKKKEDNSPQMLVIKLINGNLMNGKFSIYIRKEAGVEIQKTDFNTQQKYGEDENNKKSLVPYIVDLKAIRGEESSANKTSKILFYSENSELQMYYIPDDKMVPVKLFSGNIALAYTNPDLAKQKYHATTLILLSENLDEDAVSNSFRFHTKMFKSEDQIEFFVSQNSEGRTLNFPLSLEMNTCDDNNKKLYYILNYNKPEPIRSLHLEMVFGAYLRARIAREINAETWDDLISTSMTVINDFQIDLTEKSQHIDVIEIECISPLLINAYYSYENYPYNNVRQGEIVIKDLEPKEEFQFTIEPEQEELFYYSLSLFNSYEEPYVTVRFSDKSEHYISGNTLEEGMTLHTPSDITIINKVKSKTRLIFKNGLNVENGKDWSKDTSANIDGTLFVNNNKFVYKFPTNKNKRDYKTIDFLVNGINEGVENVKFCYSTNLGVAMGTSRENCFRTGKFIPYTLTFINPLIVSKNYATSIDKYYISFRPFESNEFIKLNITENKYTIPNRNDEGVAQKITLSDKKASSILSLPQYLQTNVFVQIRSCTNSELPLNYSIYNAFTGKYEKQGKTYFNKDKGYGIYTFTDIIYLESEVRFEADEAETNTVSAFLKHTSIGNNKIAFQENYLDLTFDNTKNSISIKKPIINEEFTIWIIVDAKGTLGKYTQCDLAFSDKTTIGKYHKNFISVKSNVITHFIDFAFIGFDVGKEFDLIVYAIQKSNSKLEFLYPVFQGVVGEVSGVEPVSDYIEGDQYVTLNFQYDLNSNYLYYDFPKSPLGKAASLKVLTATAKVTKVGCTFVSKYASQSTMVAKVNNAMLEDQNMCLDLGSSINNEFNALINANYTGDNSRLVVQILYGLGETKNENDNIKDEENTINIKISGSQFGDFTGLFELDEKLAPTPYIINLEDIRKKKINNNYVSRILFYSNTTEMTVHYINDQNTVPVKLFSGNIMLIYTNPDLIYQKYNNAKTMILTTNALGKKVNIINVKYFDSNAQIQYYVSSDETGRVLNNPTAIEMTSCDLPYYYILNYNKIPDKEMELHLDSIFGEVESVKLETSLNYTSWDKMLENMILVDGENVALKYTDYHFDILEVKCKLPLLLNLYYVDPSITKTKDLEVGDIVIFSLKGGERQSLIFKEDLTGPFALSFNVHNGYNVKPNIRISFEDDPEYDLIITENGLHVKDSYQYYQNITFENLDLSSGLSTRIIFKFGYVIESIFEEIGDTGVYSNEDDKARDTNLYAYKYDSTFKRLNYTGVDFQISTIEQNVKFCYSTNLGTYIKPSVTNCFRVGKDNPYTIVTKNPLVMYKDYFQKDVNNYYVGFRTMELNQKIVITPKPKKYDTDKRNIEGIKNKLTILGDQYSTILTPPQNNNPYLFTQIHVCTKGRGLSYQFYNAYNGKNLGFDGNIMPDSKFNYLSVPNSKLDTELKLKGQNNTEVFVKHVGAIKQFHPYVENIKFNYSATSHKLNWTQPIINKEFKYNIYIDQIYNIRNKEYTLCSIVGISKLGRYSKVLTTNSREPYITLDFNEPDLKDCKEFDVIIVAEQTDEGKMTILSPVYNSRGESTDGDDENNEPDEPNNNNIGLIVIIIILSLIIIGGGIAAIFIIRKYKSKGSMITDGKATSMAMLGGTQNDKLIESQAAVDP